MTSQQSVGSFGTQQDQSLVLLYPADGDPYLDKMKRLLQKRQTCEVHEMASADAILKDVAQAGAALLFLSIREVTELKPALQCLSQLQSLIQSNSLIVHVITDVSEESVLTLLRARGCSEIFSTSTSWDVFDDEVRESAHIFSMQRLLNDFPKAKSVSEISEKTIPRFNPEDWISPVPQMDQKLKIWMGSDQAIEAPLVEADLIEFGEDSLKLDVCAKMFTRGEHVFLVVEDSSKGSSSKVKLSVTLTAIVAGEGQHETVTVLLGEGFKKYIKPSQEAHEKFQKAVLEFLKSARGW